jgi:hypothetical protein
MRSFANGGITVSEQSEQPVEYAAKMTAMRRKKLFETMTDIMKEIEVCDREIEEYLTIDIFRRTDWRIGRSLDTLGRDLRSVYLELSGAQNLL